MQDMQQQAGESTEGKRYVPGMSLEDIGRARQVTRENFNGLSRSMSEALRRGQSLTEKKSAWPFDIYQATNLYPVDYKYWTRPVQTSVGESRCVAMHAHAYTPSGDQIAADQVFHKEAMKRAHLHAMQAFMRRTY